MRDGPARNAESNFWQGLDNPRVSRAVGYDDSNHGTKELVPDEIRQRTKYNENHRSTPPHPRCRRGAPCRGRLRKTERNESRENRGNQSGGAEAGSGSASILGIRGSTQASRNPGTGRSRKSPLHAELRGLPRREWRWQGRRRGVPHSQAARFRKGQLSAALNGHGQFADGRGPLPRSVTGRSGNSNAALEANA